jgi:hypothetical protein
MGNAQDTDDLSGLQSHSTADARPVKSRMTGIDGQLEALARQFSAKAKRIDPSITGAGYVIDLQSPRGAFYGVYFERKTEGSASNG